MSDYKALIERARDYANGPYTDPSLPVYVMVNGLADAVETLEAERDALRAQLGTERDYSTISSAIRVRDANIRQLTRDRDSLQAQLDSMTTEERSSVLRVNDKGKVDIGPIRYEQRKVGPWVEV